MSGRARTLTFRATDTTFAVESPDSTLVATVADLYAHCRTDGEPEHRIAIEPLGGSWSVVVDDVPTLEGASASIALARAVWQANQWAQRSDRTFLLHAAAAAIDGDAVVISAPPDAGKSTLVTALVRAGFEYLTDEVVALQPDGTVTSFPKPIGLDPRARELFPGIPVDDRLDGWSDLVRYVAPDALGRTGRVHTRLRMVLLPRYEPGAATHLEPVGAAAAAVALAGQSFNFSDLPGSLATLAGALRRTHAFRVVLDDLDDACRAIGAAFAQGHTGVVEVDAPTAGGRR